MIVCVGCDQFTKHIASSYLGYKQLTSYAGDSVRLYYTENKGAFLGMGDDLSDRHRFVIFTVVVALILTVILIFAIFNTSLSKFNVVAYSLILGGGSSNLYDRVLHDGAVIDFLNIGIGQLRTGIFNVADVFVTLGAIMLLIAMMAQNNKKPEIG